MSGRAGRERKRRRRNVLLPVATMSCSPAHLLLSSDLIALHAQR
jgi:hypothetical protein